MSLTRARCQDAACGVKYGRAYRICLPYVSCQKLLKTAGGLAELTIMSMKLKHRLHNSFLHPNPLPNLHLTIRTTGPDLITYQVHNKSLIRSRLPSAHTGEFPPGASDVPNLNAVASAFDDAQIAPAGTPEQLGDACSLLFFFPLGGGIVEGEDGNGVAPSEIIIETDAACECSGG